MAFSFMLIPDKFGDQKEKLLDDVEVLMESANQTSFLYTLAFYLWQKVGNIFLPAWSNVKADREKITFGGFIRF